MCVVMQFIWVTLIYFGIYTACKVTLHACTGYTGQLIEFVCLFSGSAFRP
jgi:hypothetical protein